MKVHLRSPMSIASRLLGIGWHRNLTGWHITGVGLISVIILTVVVVLAWGDTLSFPKVLDKEIPSELVSVSVESQGDLERGIISRDLRRAFREKEAGISDRAKVSTVKEGHKWLITAPSEVFVVVKEGSELNIGDGLLKVSALQFQSDLAKGNIPENLREGFRFKGIGISDSAKVSTLEVDSSWVIEDPSKKYAVTRQNFLNVGDEEVPVLPETQEDLNNGLVSDNLRVTLRGEEISLSDSVTVSTLEEGNSWLLTDQNLATTYTITLGEVRLDIDEVEETEIFLNEDIADGVDTATDYVTREGDFVFDFIGDVIKEVLTWIEDALLWLPYPVLIAGIALLAWRMAGLGVALFSGVSLLSIGFVGLWPSSMETLSLMLIAVTISTLIAMPIGIIAARNNAVDATLRPVLDAMQTMPSFVYLVPAIFFFGLGTSPRLLPPSSMPCPRPSG